MKTLINYDNPHDIKAFLEMKGFGMQKKFGQNFLINRGIREKQVAALDLKPGLRVWEIGPGLGAVTELILKSGAELTVFEIDKGFASCLRDFFSEYRNFTVVEGDALKTVKSCFLDAEKCGKLPDRLFGNLPYNIASDFIARLTENGIVFEKAVLTVQKEVARRMTAQPGTKDYSYFSVLCQWAYDIKTLCDLGPGFFWPRPHVDSRTVVLDKKALFPETGEFKLALSLAKTIFLNRRKTIKNNILSLARSGEIFSGENSDSLVSGFWAEIGLNENIRGENLSYKEIINLAEKLSEKI